MHFTVLTLWRGALALSNCRLLRNCFGKIFKDAIREAGVWHPGSQMTYLYHSSLKLPAAFCWGLPLPRGLPCTLEQNRDLKSKLLLGPSLYSWWRTLTAHLLADSCLFAHLCRLTALQEIRFSQDCFPPCSEQLNVNLEMPIIPMDSHSHHVLTDRSKGFAVYLPPLKVHIWSMHNECLIQDT